MAENKKGIIIYVDLIHTIKKVIEKDRLNGTNNSGELFFHILQYTNDLDPAPINDTIDFLFEPIKQQLKRDLKKYESIIESRVKAGLASAESRKQKQQVSTSVESVEQEPTNPTVIVTDKDTDTVIVTETVKEKPILKEKKKKVAAIAAVDLEFSSDFKECCEAYNNFIKELTGGADAKFDSLHGKSMKEIICYMKTQMKEPGAKVSTGLKVIFDNWGKLEPFLQNQTKLNQINSNLQNIIIQIKHNGKLTATKEATIGRTKVSDLEKFRERYDNEESKQKRY